MLPLRDSDSKPARAITPFLGAILAGGIFFNTSIASADLAIKPYFETKKPKAIFNADDISLDTNGLSAPFASSTGSYVFGFEGISQYDGATLGRNFVPPDTMGAVGMTQYMEVSNGAYAVYNKATGVRQSLVSDVAFWASAGQTGANGDSRVMYNADAQRWVVVSFGSNVKDLQIAVSDTDDALGTWKSTKFEGYSSTFSPVADYPTLALDKNAVYIGTNDFAASTSGGAQTFRGTTLNVIPLNSLFNAGAPTTTNMKQFVTPSSTDRGFSLQGVNSSSAGSSGSVVAVSLVQFDSLAYKVDGLSTTSATGATLGAIDDLNLQSYAVVGAARQPATTVPANQRVIDALDDRISSSVYEANGRIYAINTVNSNADALDETRLRLFVLDATTFDIIDQEEISAAGFDYYQGSLAVNAYGQVVIGYNRSGLTTADANGDGLSDGNISFMARTFDTLPDGTLSSTSSELLLKASLTDDYHNGSSEGLAAAGRQRWGDYAQVSVDPADPFSFYLVGQFAREYNNAANGHPGGSGFARWGTWIAEIEVTAIPEPTIGFAAAGLFLFGRRRHR